MAQSSRRPSVFGSIASLAIGTLFLFVSVSLFLTATWMGRDDPNAYVQRLYLETEKTFRAAIDPRFQTKADEVGRVATRLVVIDIVKGGALYDDRGHQQAPFGEAPETSFQMVSLTGLRIFPTSEKNRFEFYYSPAVTETPFHLMARIDAGTMSQLESMAFDRRVGVALAGGFAAALAGAAVVWLFVARPIRQTIRVMEKAIADPATADHGEALPTGRSEIGVLAILLERVRSTVGEMWRNKVTVADAILESAPFAVVQMSQDGSPIFANPASSTVFLRDVVRSQNATPLVVKDMATGARSVLHEHLGRHPGETRLVEIPTSEGNNYGMLGGFTIGQKSKTPITLALVSDVTTLQRALMSSAADLAAERRNLLIKACREFELKLMLESCLTLLSGTGSAQEGQIDPLTAANEWLDAAVEVGLVSGKSVSPEAPLVAGHAEEIRSVMRLALLVCNARVGSFPTIAAVDVRGISFDTVGVTIRTAPEAGAEQHQSSSDWQLAFAALRTAMRKIGGQLGEFESDEDGTSLKMILRGASERLQTGIRNKA